MERRIAYRRGGLDIRGGLATGEEDLILERRTEYCRGALDIGEEDWI